MRRALAPLFSAAYTVVGVHLIATGDMLVSVGTGLVVLARAIRRDRDVEGHADPAAPAERKAAHSDLEAAFARAKRVYPQHFGAPNELGGSVRIPPPPRRPFGFN
jgi:hypothetical protein